MKAKRKHPTSNIQHPTPKSMEIARETPEEIFAARQTLMIMVLASSRQHYEHYRRLLWGDSKTRFFCPHDEVQLMGLRPNAIIELPEWWLGKSPVFLDRVELLKRSIEARTPAQ